jgi:hypothetical protein
MPLLVSPFAVASDPRRKGHMSQKTEFVQLETSDDAASVRDRLSFLRGRRVLLIWPEEGTVLTRKLDLVLIQREAMRFAIRLAVVTHDAQVIQHAHELNISTFETIGASERGRWKRGRSKVFTTRFQRPDEGIDSEELKEAASRLNDAEGRRGGWLGRIALMLVFIGLVGGIAYVVAPSAAITLVPAQERIPVEALIIADPAATDVNIERAVIPSVTLRVEIEETGTIPTSGRQALSDILAVGSVVFINQTDAALSIAADTVLSTSAGTPILFRTTQPAQLPAEVGTQVEVPIEALPGAAGDTGNVEAGLINTVVGDLAQQVSVLNLAPTYGGESRTQGVVTVEDQERLLATLRQQLQSRAFLGMEEQTAQGQTIILETIRIAEEREDWKTWSAQPGEIAEQLTLTMRARVEAVVIDENFARQIAFARIQGQTRQAGRVLIPNSIEYQCCTLLSIDTASGRVEFAMRGEAVLTSQINVETLQQQLSGRSLDDATAFLAAEVDLAEGTLPQISLSPQWMPHLPLLPLRIGIQTLSLDL